ncbi:maleylpyruvate isomerase N-terminal domain-containing protein [Intrasporangium mesophilum]
MPARPDLRQAFLAATDHVIAIVARDEVAAAWDEPSALADWRLGGLVAHLASQPVTAARLLDSTPASDPIPLEEHYARAAWVTASLDDEINVAIREGSDEKAEVGREEVLAGVVAARKALPELLAAAPEDRAVLIPWQGWSLALDDFLVGRMMEIVVHGEDVAASLGVPAPSLPAAVLDPVLGLLAHLAVRRHGQAAVVAALTRTERAPATISAF